MSSTDERHTTEEREVAGTVATIEELDALPERSVIRERDTGPWLGIPTVPGVFEKFPNGLGWFVVAGHGEQDVASIELPAMILYRPATTEERETALAAEYAKRHPKTDEEQA